MIGRSFIPHEIISPNGTSAYFATSTLPRQGRICETLVGNAFGGSRAAAAVMSDMIGAFRGKSFCVGWKKTTYGFPRATLNRGRFTIVLVEAKDRRHLS